MDVRFIGERFQFDNYVWFRVVFDGDVNFFFDWICEFDDQLVGNKKKVFFLLKFSRQYEEIENGFRSIKFMYLLKNMNEVSMNNLFDVGFFEEFKIRYRGNCFQYFLE